MPIQPLLKDAVIAAHMVEIKPPLSPQEAKVEGVYVTAFSYPVVPKGKARIRTQMSSALSEADVDETLAAFARVKERL